ncbi:hypothetical protein ACHAW5_007658 [Stephanodiscus triporus]|uniref:PNPLA domain-containing protein n=1 Tax=Stephanodiscus triporus TaxID=2934178 RepID=A0ABD3MUA9_9STRA
MKYETLDSSEVEALLRHFINEAANFTIKNLPEMRKGLLEALDLVFIPRQIATQVVLAVALETSMVTVNQIWSIFRSIAASVSTHSRLIRQLHQQQRIAESQDEWMDLAEQIDNIQGNDIWRTEKTCALYESERIQSRIDELVHLMRRRDIFDLMFTLRGGIGRNHYGLLHEGLFSRAIAGSKLLIETYHNVVCAALDFVCDAPVAPNEDPIPSESRLAFFNETRHSYGRTAFLCSGGAALGFYHVGVVKALMLNGLMPRVLGGSSAGSIVTAIIATRTDEECFRDFFNVKGTDAPGHSGKISTDFFRPVGYAATNQGGEVEEVTELISSQDGGFKRAFQLFFPLTLRNLTSYVYDVITGYKRPKDILKSDTRHLENCLKNNIGDFTFQEAFDRTGRILNITVSPQSRSDPPRLLNYLTSPHVLIWSAALASASLPGVFEANRLMVKDADGREIYETTSGMAFQDGSMEADLPMQQLSEMFNINHFIISQANPHAVMFSNFGLERSVWAHPLVGYVNSILSFMKNQIRSYLRNVFDLFGGRRIAPLWDTRRNMGTQFFTQEYEGRETDISLIPWNGHRSLTSALFNLIKNPTPEEFQEWIHAAERETWRFIPRIKSHCAEERTLDLCVQRLRKKIMVESWEARHSSSQQMLQPSRGDGTLNLNQRTPSFFQSPSLVCMGGLNVCDPYETMPIVEEKKESTPRIHSNLHISEHVDATSGWGGMGLRGNHSYTNLHRSNSSGSGIFIGDDSENEQDDFDSGVPPMNGNWASTVGAPSGYIKTSKMANFYYRKSLSHGELADAVEQDNTRDHQSSPSMTGK